MATATLPTASSAFTNSYIGQLNPKAVADEDADIFDRGIRDTLYYQFPDAAPPSHKCCVYPAWVYSIRNSLGWASFTSGLRVALAMFIMIVICLQPSVYSVLSSLQISAIIASMSMKLFLTTVLPCDQPLRILTLVVCSLLTPLYYLFVPSI